VTRPKALSKHGNKLSPSKILMQTLRVLSSHHLRLHTEILPTIHIKMQTIPHPIKIQNKSQGLFWRNWQMMNAHFCVASFPTQDRELRGWLHPGSHLKVVLLLNSHHPKKHLSQKKSTNTKLNAMLTQKMGNISMAVSLKNSTLLRKIHHLLRHQFHRKWLKRKRSVVTSPHLNSWNNYRHCKRNLQR